MVASVGQYKALLDGKRVVVFVWALNGRQVHVGASETKLDLASLVCHELVRDACPETRLE
jgi:hypothetical protein